MAGEVEGGVGSIVAVEGSDGSLDTQLRNDLPIYISVTEAPWIWGKKNHLIEKPTTCRMRSSPALGFIYIHYENELLSYSKW